MTDQWPFSINETGGQRYLCFCTHALSIYADKMQFVITSNWLWSVTMRGHSLKVFKYRLHPLYVDQWCLLSSLASLTWLKPSVIVKVSLLSAGTRGQRKALPPSHSHFFPCLSLSPLTMGCHGNESTGGDSYYWNGCGIGGGHSEIEQFRHS